MVSSTASDTPVMMVVRTPFDAPHGSSCSVNQNPVFQLASLSPLVDVHDARLTCPTDVMGQCQVDAVGHLSYTCLTPHLLPDLDHLSSAGRSYWMPLRLEPP